MSITKAKTAELVKSYKTTDTDNGGSAEAQVAILTERIRNLTDHMKANHKDQHSKRGLLLMVKPPQEIAGLHQEKRCCQIRRTD